MTCLCVHVLYVCWYIIIYTGYDDIALRVTLAVPIFIYECMHIRYIHTGHVCVCMYYMCTCIYLYTQATTT